MDQTEDITQSISNPETQSNSFADNLQQALEAWEKFNVNYLSERLNERALFVHELLGFTEDMIKKLPYGSKYGNESLSNHKEAIFQHIKPTYQKPGAPLFPELHQIWHEKALEIIAQLPEKIIKDQLPERFFTQPGDGFIKLLKFFKRWFFYFSRMHLYFINIFRKNKFEIKYWSHSPNLQGLFQYHFVNDFLRKWTSLEDAIGKEYCKIALEIKQWEENSCATNNPPEPPNVTSLCSALQKDVIDEVKKWFESSREGFEAAMELSGTMEYNDRKLGPKQQDRRLQSEIKKWNKNHQNWGNTLYALFEDWRSDLELGSLQHYVTHCSLVLTQTFEQWGEKSKKDYLGPILSYLSQAKHKFNHLEGAELAKLISQTQYQIKKSMNLEMIKPLEERLSKNTLLSQMDRVEHLLRERIKSLQQAYAVIKSGSFNKALDADELYSVSNFELISFEIQPRYEEKLDNIKNELLMVVNELLIQAGDIDEVITFTLNTAAANLKNRESDTEQCEGIINEGFERAYHKTEEIDQRLDEILKESKNDFVNTLNKLKISIQELTETENVSAIRLRISKAKAIKQSVALKDRLLQFFAKRWGKAKLITTRVWTIIQSWQTQVKQLLIPSASSAVPSRDVSDFLIESSHIIESLPLIYRRLYTIEPLLEPVLFEGREEEIKTIFGAFDQWKQGRFGSVLITGEMWSGLTTLINYLLSENKLSNPTYRYAFEETLTDPTNLYAILSRLLNEDSLESTSEIIDHLNSSEKKIIILEDIQHLYLRKINGMRALMEIVEIVAATHKQIFWIVTLSSYAAQYLEKNIQLSSFFSYPISLENFSEEQISNLIIKRNRISGFKIIFEAGDNDQQDKKFIKLDEKGKQHHLKTRFFKELNNFARHNVSLALSYWLLSTKKVTKNTIIISPFKKLDLSFLHLLSDDRIFVLHSLILHDGLKAQEIQQVLSMPSQKINMLLLAMEEDGLLYQEKEAFVVHPLVYRGVVQLLKSKNLLY